MRFQIEMDAVSLSYIELHSKKKPCIVFIHGNSSSAEAWHHQLADSLFEDFRLIAFDLPAHGQSSEDKSHKYGIDEMAKSLSDALNNLNIRTNYLLVGVSLGSNIATEMLTYLKPAGIVLAGPTIIGDDLKISDIFKQDADVNVLFIDENSKEDIRNYFKQVIYKLEEEELTNNLINDFCNVKAPFRSRLFLKAKSDQIPNEFEILRNSKLKPLIVFGGQDKIVNQNYLDNSNIQMWREKPKSISNAGHLVHLDQPPLFNQILFEYAKECFKEA